MPPDEILKWNPPSHEAGGYLRLGYIIQEKIPVVNLKMKKIKKFWGGKQSPTHLNRSKA